MSDQLRTDALGVARGALPFGALFGLDADDIHSFADVADDLMAAGQVKDALMLYEGCVQLDPLDVTLLCGYATVLRHNGDVKRARQVVTLIEQMAPEDPHVGAFLEGTHLSQV